MAGAKVDISGYQKWEQVKLPDGRVLYRSPSTPGWLYDPVLSGAKGRSVFVKDPSLDIQKQKEAEDAAKRQQELQEQAMSPTGQLVPVVGATAGTVGGAYLINSLGKTPAKLPTETVPTNTPSPVSTTPTTTPAPVAEATTTTNSAVQVLPQSQPIPPGYEAVGQNADGSTMIAPSGTEVTASELGSVASQAGVVLQAIRIGQQGWQAYQRGEGKGAIEGAKAGVKGDGSFLDTLQNFDPFALQARIFGGALGGIFGTKKTKQVQSDRWRNLAETGAITPEQLAARESLINSDQRGQDPITGQKWKFETALERVKQGGAAADEFAETYGPRKLFGKDWDTYTPDQKRAIITENATANNWDSSKGDVLFKDEEKAKEIKDKVLSGQVAPQGFVNTVMAQRSNTRSPGIDKNGRRISY